MLVKDLPTRAFLLAMRDEKPWLIVIHFFSLSWFDFGHFSSGIFDM
jgi:hypothetical protein